MPPNDTAGASLGVLGAVIGVSACASYASLFVAPLSPFLVDGLGLGYAAVGALNAAVFVGAALASPRAGRWVDRLGPGSALTTGVGLMACFFALAAAVGGDYRALLGASALAGVAFALVNPAANIAVGVGFDPARRGTIMGVKQTGISLGGIAAGVWLPTVAIAYGWRIALLQIAAMLAVASIASAWVLGPPRRLSQLPTVAAQSRMPRFYALWTGGVLLSCPQAFLMTYLVLYVAQEGILGRAGAGLLFAAVQLAALVGRVAFGVVSDFGLRGQRRGVLVFAALGGAASMLGLALVSAGGLGGIAALAVLGGLTAIGWNGVYMAALVDVAPEATAGAVSGIGVGLNLGAVVVFPLAAGALLDAGIGFRVLWSIAAAFALAAALAFRFARDPERLVVAPPRVAV